MNVDTNFGLKLKNPNNGRRSYDRFDKALKNISKKLFFPKNYAKLSLEEESPERIMQGIYIQVFFFRGSELYI